MCDPCRLRNTAREGYDVQARQYKANVHHRRFYRPNANLQAFSRPSGRSPEFFFTSVFLCWKPQASKWCSSSSQKVKQNAPDMMRGRPHTHNLNTAIHAQGDLLVYLTWSCQSTELDPTETSKQRFTTIQPALVLAPPCPASPVLLPASCFATVTYYY